MYIYIYLFIYTYTYVSTAADSSRKPRPAMPGDSAAPQQAASAHETRISTAQSVEEVPVSLLLARIAIFMPTFIFNQEITLLLLVVLVNIVDVNGYEYPHQCGWKATCNYVE